MFTGQCIIVYIFHIKPTKKTIQEKTAFFIYFFIPYNIVVEYCHSGCTVRRRFFKKNVLGSHYTKS